MEKILFELKGVDFTYLGKFPALNKIDLSINQGEIIAFLGANGSGKSTLLNLLAGLIYPQSGTLKAFGRLIDPEVFADEDFRRFFRSNVGFLFQNPEAQLFCSTVEEELYFGPLQLDLPADKMRGRIEELAGLLDIKKLLPRTPYQLSLGEKKKVAIASVLAVDPAVLLLDEPTAGLDPRTGRELIDLIADYHAQDKTVAIATHDLHLVAEVADRIYILDAQKRIVASGNCEDILSDQDLLIRHNLAHIHKHKHEGAWHLHPHQHSVPPDISAH